MALFKRCSITCVIDLVRYPIQHCGFRRSVYECTHMKYATPSMVFPRITRKDNLITDEIMTNNYLSVFERVLDDDPKFTGNLLFRPYYPLIYNILKPVADYFFLLLIILIT